MVIFPEGTRYNPLSTDVIEKSQTFAKERGKFSCETLSVYAYLCTMVIKVFLYRRQNKN